MSQAGFVKVEGGRLYYEVDGDGHPVLLIHGGLGSLRMWDEQISAFAERYRVVRYDTRGWGQSETEDVEYTDVADAIAVLDHLGADTAHVVGQSRGGGIALDLALEHPDRTDSLVSVAGGVHGYEAERDEATRAAFDQMEPLWEAKDWTALAELETRVWVDGWGQPATRVEPSHPRRVQDRILEGYAAELPWGKPQPIQPPAAERLEDVHVPTLVLIGAVDEAGGVAAGRHLAASVPGAHAVELPDVAHMIQLEQPERFNELVLEFLAEVDRRLAG
jgi:3-oxoadipate enol-lactonase